ncbi:MAG: C-terminal helicase domain-containing protein, partial [Sphingomonas sp.]
QALRDRRARVCVATDVAARGIDLPSLSLVIHVELPRDGEALQHRSGRTGRAGKKGIAVLIVPYPRRRRTEGMLRDARVSAEWVPVPTPAMIAEADRERLFATLSAPVESDEEDRTLGARLLAELGPDEVAARLVQAHRGRLPAAEELIEAPGAGRAPPQGPRAGFEDTVWFRMNLGRRQNADPRWLLPLLCRRGHITKSEIGAIRIGADETQFEVPRAIAGRFAASLKRTHQPEADGDVQIEAMDGSTPAMRPDRAPRDGAARPPRHAARPTRPADRGR